MEKVAEFLTDYKGRAKKILEGLGEEFVNQAKEAGSVPEEVMKEFVRLLPEGKHLRGALMELSYKMCGGQDEVEILRASLAMEVLQTGFLIQDDFMDRDELRRGLPTLHRRVADESGLQESEAIHYGYCQAVNVGDVAFFLAMGMLSDSKFENEVKLKAIKVMSEGIVKVGFGQMMDMANSQARELKIDEVLKIHDFKTAEYTGNLPLVLGAGLAGADEETLGVLGELGMKLGRAFQMQDDLLGVFGETKNLGKEAGVDIREGKNTVLMAKLKEISSVEMVEIKKLAGKKVTKSSLETAREIFRKTGVYDWVCQRRDEYLNEAVQLIRRLEVKEEYREILKEIVLFLTKRKK